MTIPLFLSPGDLIGIAAPAGAVEPGAQDSAVAYLEARGYRTRVSPLVGAHHLKFAGPDNLRRDEMQKMLNDPEIRAILCARGGYGSVRIIDDLDFSKFAESPKWIVGFSDITTFHSHLHTALHTASMHGQMLRGWWPEEMDEQSTDYWIQTLEGRFPDLDWTDNQASEISIEAQIVGGNLAILSDLCGTDIDIDTSGKILVIEEVSEYLYNIDRMLMQFRKAGKLKNLKALIIGAFTDIQDNDIPFGESIEQIVQRVTADYDYPVVHNMPIGHQPQNWPLLLGHRYRLQKDGFGVNLHPITIS